MAEKKSDKYIPLYFVAFFVVVAAVNAVFVYFAVSTHSGVITENAYEKGLAYNQVVSAVEQQNQLGWQGEISYEGEKLLFALKDKSGKKISSAKVVAYIARPLNAMYDTEIEMQQNGQGGYEALHKLPLNGQWEIEVLATWQGQKYQLSKRLVLQ